MRKILARKRCTVLNISSICDTVLVEKYCNARKKQYSAQNLARLMVAVLHRTPNLSLDWFSIVVSLSPRTLCLRKDSGKWLADPQEAYDHICQNLKKSQLGLEQLFFLSEDLGWSKELLNCIKRKWRYSSLQLLCCCSLLAYGTYQTKKIDGETMFYNHSWTCLFYSPLAAHLCECTPRLEDERRRCSNRDRPYSEDWMNLGCI